MHAKTHDPPEQQPEETVDLSAAPLRDHLEAIGEALGEVHKHLTIVYRRLAYIEDRTGAATPTQPVTLVTLPTDEQQ